MGLRGRACSTAVGVEAATARMAPVFGGRMDTKVETPNMPRLEMVKVPAGGWGVRAERAR